MNTETKEEILAETEKVVDLIDTAEERVVEVVKNNPAVLAGVALVAASAGAVAGYFFAKKKLTLQYEQLAQREIAEAKAYFSTEKPSLESLKKEEVVETHVDEDGIIEERQDLLPGEIIRAYKGKDEETSKVIEIRAREESTVIEHNIFVNNEPIVKDDWDYVEEIANRSEDKPFIIHKDEFFGNEDDYEQVQITYYAGDNVLADEDDRTIDNIDRHVGVENLKRFGHGSEDANTLYVRNNKIGQVMEIVLSQGKYSEEVLDLGEYESDDRPPIRKFRGSDD